MKIYKSNFIKYTLSFSLVIVFGLYFINNISNHSNIDNAKFNSINSNNKSLEWFIEDFTLTNFDKSGALSHTLTASNAYKYQENNFIKLDNPYLNHYPYQDHNKFYNITAKNALIYNLSTTSKKIAHKKNVTNNDIESIIFNNDVFIKTPEIIAKSQTLSYNIDKQFMQLNNNVETIYTKKS